MRQPHSYGDAAEVGIKRGVSMKHSSSNWTWVALAIVLLAIVFFTNRWCNEQDKQKLCANLAISLLSSELSAENRGALSWAVYGEADSHLHGLSREQWIAMSAEASRSGARDEYSRLAELGGCPLWEDLVRPPSWDDI